MSFVEKRPRKWGDRRDGHWVKDAPGLNVVLCSLLPKRTESEVYLHQEIDVTDLLKYLEGKNTPDAPIAELKDSFTVVAENSIAGMVSLI